MVNKIDLNWLSGLNASFDLPEDILNRMRTHPHERSRTSARNMKRAKYRFKFYYPTWFAH